MNLLETVTTPPVEWAQLSPLLVVFVGASLGILIEAFVPRGARFGGQVILTSVSLSVALAFTVFNWVFNKTGAVAASSVMLDTPTYFIWTMLLGFSLLAMLLFAERQLTAGASAFVSSGASVPGSPLEREADKAQLEHTEVYPLLLFAVTGMLLFPASNNLLMMFVALEVFSLPLYLMCGLARRRRLLSQEAAIKYFLLGALSSAFFLYGIALLYGYSGSFNLAFIDAAIILNREGHLLLLAGMSLVAVGLLFKIGAVPFHSWTPDVYMGAPTPVTGFMAIATKLAAVGALLRVIYVALGGLRWTWQPLFIVIAIITMALGAALAIVQSDVKRMLAYSSIAHAGFILVGLVGASTLSTAAITVYLATYGFATLGAFAIVTMVRKSGGESNEISTWTGLGRRHPVIGGLFALFMLSFAGIPLTAGFIGKWMVFVAAWAGGFPWLVFLAVLFSLIAGYFYVRMIVVMFFREPTEETAELVYPSVATWLVVVFSALATVALGIVPGWLINIASGASVFLR